MYCFVWPTGIGLLVIVCYTVFGKWCHIHCCDQFRLLVNGKFTENFHILVLHLPHFFWCVLVCLTRAFIMFACWLGHCQGCTTHLGVPYLWLFFTFEPNLSGEGREGGGCERSVLSCGNYSYVTSVI